MTQTLRRAALVAALLVLCWAPVAQAYTWETLIDETDATSSTQSAAFINQGTDSVWYFKLKVTAISASTLTLYFQYWDEIDGEWDYWMDGVGALAAAGETVVVFLAKGNTTDHAALATTSNNDIDQVNIVPMPGRWRVEVYHTAAQTSSYTVTHWRY